MRRRMANTRVRSDAGPVFPRAGQIRELAADLSRGAAWTPASLFTSESGDWWLPTPGYVFTDAGTTAATNDGDALYQINGQRGTINFVQTSAGARPTLQLAEINGNPTVRHDGTNDVFADISITLPNPFELTWFGAVKTPSDTRGLWHRAADDPSVSISGSRYYLNSHGASLSECNTSVMVADSWHSLIARARNASRNIWVDGSVDGTNSAADTGPTGAVSISPFQWDAGSITFSKDWACWGYIARYLTDDEMALLATYLGGLIA